MKGPVVIVEWVDSCIDHRWVNLQDATSLKPSTCEVYGKIIVRDKERLVVAHGFGGDDETYATTAIPISCVKRIRKLREI